MGRWLDAFQAEIGCVELPAANSANSAKSPVNENVRSTFRPIGTNGTYWHSAFQKTGDMPEPSIHAGLSREEGAIGPIGAIGTGEKRETAPDPDYGDQMDDYEERAAILEFHAGHSRADAERLAWAEVFGTARPAQ